MLGAAVRVADDDVRVFGTELSVLTHPWLAEHVVWDSVVVPGAALVEMVLHAGAQVGCDTLDELTLQAPLALAEDGTRAVQVKLGAADEDGRRTVTIHSRAAADPDGEWDRHAAGVLAPAVPQPDRSDPAPWPPSAATAVAVDGIYTELSRLGVEYGPSSVACAPSGAPATGVRRGGGARRHRGRRLRPASRPAGRCAARRRPARLDAEDASGVRLPFAWTGVTLSAVGATALRVRARRSGGGVA
ncbi:hypothetical protein V2I01_30480 [Micromonospora sp. BRA006-A]|nr:hypothetical protein [Micromonospora sp. BRA006-A]